MDGAIQFSIKNYIEKSGFKIRRTKTLSFCPSPHPTVINNDEILLVLFISIGKTRCSTYWYIQLRTSDWRQSSKSNWATKFQTTPIYFYDMTERDTFHYYYCPKKHKKGGGLIVSFLCIFYYLVLFFLLEQQQFCFCNPDEWNLIKLWFCSL